MALFHKPRPGPGFSFRPFILHRSKLFLFLRFLLGLIAGIFFTEQLQISLITSGACIQFKLSPLHRQLKVKTLESADVETTGKQLLLVGVMTADKYIATRAKAVYETWGNRVPGKIIFFTAGTHNTTEDLPVVPLRGVDDSYPPQKKSFMMLKYMFENYGDKFEWFMRADDDVFVKTDHLELFLRSINSSRPVFIGQAGKGSQVLTLVGFSISFSLLLFIYYCYLFFCAGRVWAIESGIWRKLLHGWTRNGIESYNSFQSSSSCQRLS